MDPQNPRPLFDFDLNELPPPDDGGTVDASTPPQDDGGKFDDASTTAPGREPSPEDDATADASQADCLSPSQQMLDLDAPLSPMYDDDDEEDYGELQLPSPDPLYETDETEVACSPEKMTSGGCSPVIYHHAEMEAPAPPTARPYFHAGVDMATPAHPSSRVDMQGTAAPFYFSPSRHGWRTWRPNSETKAPPSAFPVRSSPETASASASRAHADVAKGASDTSSPSSHRSRLKRRLSVPRDDSASDSKPILYRGNNYEDITGSPCRRIRRSPPAYPARHRERSRRSSRAPPPRDQQAPQRTSSYKPYDGRDQRGQGHRGHEKRQGYRGDDHGPRGYAKPKFPVQQVCSDPYGPREDSYGGRQQIPAQEAPNGGYHQYREPPRVHFPAGFIQRSHPYVSTEDGAFDGTKKKNPGNQRAQRDENRPYFPASLNQRCRPYVSVDDAFDGIKKNPGNQRAVRDENRPDQHRRRRNRRQYYKDPYSQSPSGLS